MSNKPAVLLSALVADGSPVARTSAARSILIGLVGRGIGPSRSPIMHEREGARLGMDYSYRLIDFDRLGLEDSALGEIVAAAEQLGFAGLNVTHPFKQSVVPFLTDLSPEAAAIGAVNTVVFADGRRTGHNTDCWGFAESFRAEHGRLQPRPTSLQFGAGGAGAAVAYALLELGAGDLAIFDTSIARARRAGRAVERAVRRPRERPQRICDSAVERATGLVNATPVGMAKYPGLPFAAELLSPQHWVAEIIYFPAETELLELARAARLPHAFGPGNGGLPGGAGVRAVHRPRARPDRDGAAFRGGRAVSRMAARAGGR